MLCRAWLRVTGATVLSLQIFHWPLDALQNVIKSYWSDRAVVANCPLTTGCFAIRVIVNARKYDNGVQLVHHCRPSVDFHVRPYVYCDGKVTFCLQTLYTPSSDCTWSLFLSTKRGAGCQWQFSRCNLSVLRICRKCAFRQILPPCFTLALELTDKTN